MQAPEKNNGCDVDVWRMAITCNVSALLGPILSTIDGHIEKICSHTLHIWKHRSLRNKTGAVSKKFPATSDLCVCTEHKYAEQHNTSTT